MHRNCGVPKLFVWTQKISELEKNKLFDLFIVTESKKSWGASLSVSVYCANMLIDMFA